MDELAPLNPTTPNEARGPRLLWVLIRSWHLSAAEIPADTEPGKVPTLCGKQASNARPRLREAPANAKTCERCYQLRDHRQEETDATA